VKREKQIKNKQTNKTSSFMPNQNETKEKEERRKKWA